MAASFPTKVPQTKGKWHLPFPSGQYPVIGYQDIMTGGNRTDGVFVRLLFPAQDQGINLAETHEEWPTWYPHPNYKSGLADTLSPKLRLIVRLAQYFNSDFFIPILPGVELLKRDAKFPVIIFSHGLSSIRTSYSNICNQFASHGFIVAIVEHRDESAYATVYPSQDQDGFEWLPYRTMDSYGAYDGETHFDGRQEQMRLRVSEIRAVCELLENLNLGNPINNVFLEPGTTDNQDYAQFKDRIDMESIIAAGHSYGGATVIFSLDQEPRLKMGICLDSWMYSLRDFRAETLKQPLLFINMENFQSDVALLKIRQFVSAEEGTSKGREVFKIKGTRHPDISDFPMLLLSYPGWIISAVNWVVPLLSKADPFSVHQATVSLCMDFVTKHGSLSILNSNGLPPGIDLVEGITLKDPTLESGGK